jgi:tRNA dimethylallyltransferase
MSLAGLYFNDSFKKSILRGNKPYIVFGPTGTGKTNFAIKLAKEIDAEIINCDMAQIYSEIRVGVGQIKEKEQQEIPHYLFGFLKTPDLFSVYQMRIEIELKIKFILSKNKNVIIVGGSSFLVYSLFFAPSLYYDNLFYKDSFFYGLNKTKHFVFGNSQENKKKDFIVFLPIYDYTVIFFDIEYSAKDMWLDKIKERIDCFLEEGWIEEIKAMGQDWIDFLSNKKFIGYNELILYIENKNNFEYDLFDIKDKIFFRTAQYGKKQRTFLRKMKRDFLIYNVLCVDHYIKI